MYRLGTEAASLYDGVMARRRYENPPDLSSSSNARGVRAEERNVCAVHGTPLICPACIGSRGGKQRSEAKTEAARDNASRPRPGARGVRKPRKLRGDTAR